MMKFNWTNRRKLLTPSEFNDWGKTHAQVPYYFAHEGKKRIFFTSRPPRNSDGSYVSHIHSAEIETINSRFQVKKLNREALLPLGELGCFDETGTMPCSVVYNSERNEVWLYYVGWNLCKNVPYDCAIGLAVSTDGGETFKKYSSGPILGQNVHSPFLVGCPRVYRFENTWYLFYLSGVKWVEFEGKKESHYRIRMATSEDGISWLTNDQFCVPMQYELESQTCPSVFQYGNRYHMYFTFRHTVDFRNPERGYRIGYAVSDDLKTWNRDDHTGNFGVSESGWDSEMVCYPNVNEIDGKFVMFYCGNSFGYDGFGYSELA